jgi:hypothetical protein
VDISRLPHYPGDPAGRGRGWAPLPFAVHFRSPGLTTVLWSRLALVKWAFAVGGGVAALPCLPFLSAAPILWASAMTGPFAGLWAAAGWELGDTLRWASGCGLAIAAHPVWPCVLTGLVSAAGVGLWVLLGLALTFNGV